MAHARNKFREIIKDRDGHPAKTTTEGEIRAREIREKKIEIQQAIKEANLEKRKKRTPQQQIELLDKRLGKGVGAKKERARLLRKIG